MKHFANNQDPISCGTCNQFLCSHVINCPVFYNNVDKHCPETLHFVDPFTQSWKNADEEMRSEINSYVYARKARFTVLLLVGSFLVYIYDCALNWHWPLSSYD